MTDAANDTAHGSFSHAFLPGLILGLVIGAVAGAFLPDIIGGNKIPAPTHDAAPGDHSGHDHSAEPGVTDEQIQDMIDEAKDAAEDATNDALDTTPAVPPSDG